MAATSDMMIVPSVRAGRRTRTRSLSELLLVRRVLGQAEPICASLNFSSLLPFLVVPMLRFLSAKEVQILYRHDSSRDKANQLIMFLDSKSPAHVRRFLACLLAEHDHLGHQDVASRLMEKIPFEEAQKIRRIVRNYDRSVRDTPSHQASTIKLMPGPVPRQCVSQIELVGLLAGKTFQKLDRALWRFFSTGQYGSLKVLTTRIHKTAYEDYKIVALWFDALIAMHHDHDYDKCLTKCLMPALKACKNSRNQTILEGRVLQRMAQVYLTMGHKDLASMHFERAEGCLQLVGRGYDKVNMLCRRAKLLAATEPEKRDQIESLYAAALQNVTSEDSFALASQPSLVLSKAAFHLRMPFGSKPTSSDSPPPDVSSSDISKAKATLQALPQDSVILETRKCEHKLLSAEILRLDGEEEPALELFDDVVQDSERAKLDNLVAIASHRSTHIRHHQLVVDDILEGILGLEELTSP